MSDSSFLKAYESAHSTREVHERTGLSAGSLRLLAYRVGVEWPGELIAEPFWPAVDERVERGHTIQEIADDLDKTRQHIEQYLAESGQQDVQHSLAEQRRALTCGLAQALEAYQSRIIPPLARRVREQSLLSLEKALLLAEHSDKTPSELALIVNERPSYISQVMTACGVRHRTFTPRPPGRSRVYARAPRTMFSYEDVAEILGVSTQAVRQYASTNHFTLEKPRSISWTVRMHALSVPEWSASELSEALDIPVSVARKAQDPSFAPKIVRYLQILFDDPSIATPYVMRAYVDKKVSE